MKQEAIRAELARLLAGAGETEAEWSKRIGRVQMLKTWENIQCDWRVNPTGTDEQMHAIDMAAGLLAKQAPYLTRT